MNFKTIIYRLEPLGRLFLGAAFSLFLLGLGSCKPDPVEPDPLPASPLEVTSIRFDSDSYTGVTKRNIARTVQLELRFSDAINSSTFESKFLVYRFGQNSVPYTFETTHGDSVVTITFKEPLLEGTQYTLVVIKGLAAQRQKPFPNSLSINFVTAFDFVSDKFPRMSTDELLDTVQERTFRYFYDFGHPISGLSRERNSSGEIVTSGGSGFGLMALPVGVKRGFITRGEALTRARKTTSFLLNTAQTFHGAYSHWLNGSTGKVIPFGTYDNGGDLVETSYLIAGLLTLRQYFNQSSSDETELRQWIDSIYQRVEWDWYTRGQKVLYWHWSPSDGWAMNMQIRGYNECLITYIMAAASPTHGIDKQAYTNGWAQNGGIKSNTLHYGINLPLGSSGSKGGPLFFEHYTFLGINPHDLSDQYANYWDQVRNHTLINYEYCKANPKKFAGYSDSSWGLTASDNPWGYSAHDPANDRGVITPTAALSSMPYTPEESLAALEYFYYKMGHKIFKEYGFVDAFHIGEGWFANSFLAIDQGPIVVNIENYRSGLIWDLLTSAQEVKDGLKLLGFSAPYLN